MATEKLPPYDLDAEEAVLGSLVIDPETITRVLAVVRPDDFFREKNQWVYSACIDLFNRNEPINQISVAQELVRVDRLEAVGGAGFLSHLVAIVPTSLHAEYYGRIVHRLAVMRQLISAAGQIAAIGYEAGPDTDEALNKAEDIIFHLRHGESPRDFTHIKSVLTQYFDESEEARLRREVGLHRVDTGFFALDEILGGLQRSDLVVLAARPGMGKSSLALNVARNAAVEHGATVAIFSLEMTRDQLAYRLLSSESGVDSKRIRLGTYSEDEEKKILDAAGILSEAPIYIDDSPMLRTIEMRSKARRLHNEFGVDLIVVDYLGLIKGSDGTKNREQEISEISRSLKALARELSVPLIAVSQLSRAVESRQPHIPQLSDLRDSGSIEQDADVVLFIYRDDVYYNEEEWERKNPGEPYPRGIADIIVAKHRNGPIGKVNLLFKERVTKFNNLESSQ